MRRFASALLVVAALLATSCAADDDNQAVSTDTTVATGDTDSPTGDTVKFGTLDSPCGEAPDGKVATVKAEDAGRGTDKLYIGVANDRASIRAGLLQELWETTTAFVSWCNDQGGINGLPLEAIDLDGKLFEIEGAMATACTDTFALVGGGWAQDNLMFTGKDGSDFHKCGLIAFPGFAASPEFAGATDIVNVGPNPPNRQPTASLDALAQAFPGETSNLAILFPDLDSLRTRATQTIATAEQVDGFDQFHQIAYSPVSQDWGVLAQQVLASGATSVFAIGEPATLSLLNQALRDQNFEGPIATEINVYDQRTIDAAGPEAAEGITVAMRSYFGPFEEADQYPVTRQLIDILDEYSPNWTRASLVANSWSANLMFATTAKACAEEGEISRVCMLQKGQAVEDWDTGGLGLPVNIAEDTASLCSILMQVRDGKFQRLYPEKGGADAENMGMHCGELVDIEGDFGVGNRESSILDN